MNAPVLRWIDFASAERAALVDLRREVLRRPLVLDFTDEQLAAERDQLHLGAWDGARAVGCLLLAPPVEGAARMRQVAVTEAARGQGLGRRLVVEAEAEARRRGWRKITLHARDTALAFYQRLGYAAVGEPFLEVGLAHRAMFKNLPRLEAA